ncbi:MAG: inositol monophosphatase family protein, partial [Actinomycetota bacterium]
MPSPPPPSSPGRSGRADLALTLAGRVGEALMASFRTGVAAGRKPRGIVTDLDHRGEALIAAALAEAFPGDGLVSEEGTARPSASGWRWIADPLDGTTNFVSGLPNFAVSLAALDERGPAVGVVHAPALGATFWAERGRGAHGTGGTLRTSGATALADCVFLVNKAYAPPAALWDLTAGLLPHLRASRMFGSVSLDLAMVAAGWADGLVMLPADPWDVAAGVLLVGEAGGAVSDLAGRPLPPDGRTGILAAAPGVHAAALACLPRPLSGAGTA